MEKRSGYLRHINARGAAMLYRQPSKSVHVILVTGEYGKTTVALLLANLLEAGDKRVAIFTDKHSAIDGATYNQRFDTSAKALQSALASANKAHVDYVVIEVTPFIAEKHIIKTIHYNSVLATSVSDATSELFDREVEYVVLPYVDEPIDVPVAPHQIAYYGDNAKADVHIQSTTLRRGGSEISLVLDHHHSYDLASYLLGKANTQNIAAAIAMAYILGVPTEIFTEGVARLESVDGNFERVQIDAPYRLYVDSANNDESLALVTVSAKQLTKRRLLVALDETFNLEQAKEVAKFADQVTIYAADTSDGHIVLAKNLDDAATVTLRGARRDDTVILIGPHFAARDDTGQLDITHVIKGMRFDNES